MIDFQALLRRAEKDPHPLVQELVAALRVGQCAYCGHMAPRQDMGEHIDICLKHPLNAANDPEGHATEIAFARGQNDRLVALLGWARSMAHLVQHTCNQDGPACARCALERLL